MATPEKTEKAAEPKKKIELITVRTAQEEPDASGGWKVAFHEKNPAHPEGAVWIANGKEHKVARTPLVQKALIEEKIVEVK